MKKISKKIIGLTLVIAMILSATIVVAENTDNDGSYNKINNRNLILKNINDWIPLLKNCEAFQIIKNINKSKLFENVSVEEVTKNIVIFGQVFGIQHRPDGSIIAIPLENTMVIVTSYSGSLLDIVNENGVAWNELPSSIPRPELPHVTFTNERGEYRISLMHPGNYRIIAIKEGYVREIKGPYLLQWKDNLNIDFILEKALQANGFFFGKVYGKSPSGDVGIMYPLSNAKVTAWIYPSKIAEVNESGVSSVEIIPIKYVTYSDGSGNYRLPVRPGTYKITASKDAYKSEIKGPLSVSASEGIQVNFMLEKIQQESGWIYGKVWEVVKQSGCFSLLKPLENVKITAKKAVVSYYSHINNTGNIQQIWITHTDRNGNYNLSLPPGIYTLSAIKDGYVRNIKVWVKVEPGCGSKNNFKLSKLLQLNLTGPFPINMTKTTTQSIKPQNINLSSIKVVSMSDVLFTQCIKPIVLERVSVE